MTTIAYRAGILVGDTMRTANQFRDGHVRKVRRVGRLLVAAVGSVALLEAFYSWVAGGLSGQSPFHGKNEGNGFIVMPDGRAVVWDENGPYLEDHPFFAFGSGYPFAMGAMAFGATAEQAVRVAMQYDIGTGGEIHVLRIQP